MRSSKLSSVRDSITVIWISLIATCAWPAWIGGVSGTSASMLGSTGDDSIVIGVEGALMKHDRFDKGDPGFASRFDFDTQQAGEQRIPNTSLGSVQLVAGAGNDHLAVLDGNSINPNDVLEVRNTQIALGVGTNRPVIFYSDFQDIFIDPQGPGAHNAGAHIISTSPDARYTINGTLEQECFIGNPVTESLDEIQGPVDVYAGYVRLEDSDDTSENTYTLNHSTLSRSGSASITFHLVPLVQFFAGTGENQYYLKSNSIDEFQIFGGSGNEEFIFGNDQSNLDSFGFPVIINSGTGIDTAVYNDTGASQPHEYTFSLAGLTRDGTRICRASLNSTLNCGPYSDTIWVSPGNFLHVNGGGSALDILTALLEFTGGITTVDGSSSSITDPHFSPITWSEIDHLFLFGDQNSNDVRVIPSSDYPVYVDATDPVMTAPDSLKLEASGLPFILTHNEFLVLGKKLVTFAGFEMVEGPPAPPPPLNGPDLTGSFVAATLTPKGSKFAITAQFDERNIGNADAGKTVTQFFLSADTSLSPDDLPLKSKKIKFLAANGQRTIILKKKVPATANPAGKFLLAQVNSTNVLPDANPGNNVVAFGPLF